MKRQFLLCAIFFIFGAVSIYAQQREKSSYEVEILANPKANGKDTREINAVLIFEADSIQIVSRRGGKVFKEFRYSEIKLVEHSFSKTPIFSELSSETVLAIMLGSPLLFEKKEKHWLTVLGEKDFAVLKIENDNYRLIKMEFAVRDFEIENVNEDRR